MMPLEKTENEWRARVRQPDEFEWLKQIWPAKNGNPHYPFNSKGIRSIGGKLKKEDKITDQSIRFSRKKKYKWTESKIRAWIKKHNHTLKALETVKVDIVEVVLYELYSKPVKQHLKIISPPFEIRTKAYKDGQSLILKGVVNSDSLDAYGEVVEPVAVMESKDWYMEYPTVRYMHQADPVGKTLNLWQEGNLVWAEIEIDAGEKDLIRKILNGIITAFSIGFLILGREEHCPDKEKCYWKITKILLVEISPVDSPANRDARIQSVTWKSIGENDIYSLSTDKPICKGSMCGNKIRDLSEYEDLEFRTTHLKMEEEKENEIDISKKSIKSKINRGSNMKEEQDNPKNPDGEEDLPEFEEVDEPENKETPESTETESEPEETEQEKLLKVIGGLTEKVNSLNTEIQRMKMTDEERKADEELEAKVNEKTAEMQKTIDEQTAKLEEFEKKKEIEEAVEQKVKEILTGQPAKKTSLSNEVESQDDDDDEDPWAGLQEEYTDKEKAAYTEMSNILRRHV